MAATLDATLAHESHHAARFAVLGCDAHDDRVVSVAVFEGLATVFQMELTPQRHPWAVCDLATADAWIDELASLPSGVDTRPWRFAHPDGRLWIAYRAGVRIVERAKEAAGVSAADLVGARADDVLRMAGVSLDLS